MKFSYLLILLFVCAISVAQTETEILDKQPFSIGDEVTLYSKTYKDERILNVYLPASYGKNDDASYPVIYLLDGSKNEAFVHIAGLVQFGSRADINMLPESIIVGIANTDRNRDLTYPTTNEADKAEFPTSGGSKKFIQFIEEELQSFMFQNYKVSSQKTIIGHSFGGLLASEILYKKPYLFDNYIIVSPSLWWDNQSLLKGTLKEEIAEKNIFIGVGNEAEVMQTTAKALFEQVKIISSNKVHFQFFEKQTHSDVIHLATYNAFEKLFKK